ncbi:unnamed protein product (mitochondrion) [Plasmodiophora brassicae]|uniref:Small ribosomal subunit protein mS35 mitochondrial conserved domain-containing protein n=1 Tax=Plasmodiophora brassicae TaxID=37360 RepID=A0A0G4IRR7_PLABS|nr:hypothetical protein PBRA_006182 [Plasmodiophora brassicae]SPQ96112.1 unnamed protein product [Plasmodiophora brassicae]
MRQLLHVEQACRDACALAGAVRQRADLGRCPARTSSCAFSSIMATSVLGRCRAMVMQRCGARAWLSAHVPKNGGDAPSVAAAPEKAPDSDSGNASETGPSSIGAGETASSDVWLPKSFSEMEVPRDWSEELEFPQTEEDPDAPFEEEYTGDPDGIPVMLEKTRLFQSMTTDTDVPEERKVKLWARVTELKIDEADQQSLISILGTRYDPNTGVLKLTSDKYPSPDENAKHVCDLLKTLIAEAKQLTKQLAEAEAKLVSQ